MKLKDLLNEVQKEVSRVTVTTRGYMATDDVRSATIYFTDGTREKFYGSVGTTTAIDDLEAKYPQVKGMKYQYYDFTDTL
jgi:hypothetical protein